MASRSLYIGMSNQRLTWRFISQNSHRQHPKYDFYLNNDYLCDLNPKYDLYLNIDISYKENSIPIIQALFNMDYEELKSDNDMSFHWIDVSKFN